MTDIEKNSNKVKLEGIQVATQDAAKGFSVMAGAAAVAIGNISLSSRACAGQAPLKIKATAIVK